jgi:HD superfamily phosphohydrolase
VLLSGRIEILSKSNTNDFFGLEEEGGRASETEVGVRGRPAFFAEMNDLSALDVKGDLKATNKSSNASKRDLKTSNKSSNESENQAGKKKKKSIYIRDVLYGYIEVSGLALRFIDTSEFQVLRHLKQLGMATYVFPSANHTRFEHSIGCYELCGRLMRRLAEEQPELFSSNVDERKRFIDIVQIAGLLHDIGHCAESHAFDSLVAPKLNLPHHEERGTKLIRMIVAKYAIKVSQVELELIIKLIEGDRSVEPSWLSSIVNDTEAALDMDKLDYLNRDSYYLGFGTPIQTERILLHARVRAVPAQPNSSTQKDKSEAPPLTETKISSQSTATSATRLQICYHRKVLLQLVDVFQTRARLFREVYRHKTVVGLDELIGDMMRLLLPVLSPLMEPGSLQRPTDALIASVPSWISFIPSSRLSDQTREEVLVLWNRLQTRKLYKVSRTDDPSHSNLHVTLSLSSLLDDPICHLWWYDHFDRPEVRHIPIAEASAMLAAGRAVCSETVHYTLDRTL